MHLPSIGMETFNFKQPQTHQPIHDFHCGDSDLKDPGTSTLNCGPQKWTFLNADKGRTRGCNSVGLGGNGGPTYAILMQCMCLLNYTTFCGHSQLLTTTIFPFQVKKFCFDSLQLTCKFIIPLLTFFQ